MGSFFIGLNPCSNGIQKYTVEVIKKEGIKAS